MLRLVHSAARPTQVAAIEAADQDHAERHTVPMLRRTAAALAGATLYPWVLDIVWSRDAGVGQRALLVVEAPMHRPPVPEQHLPEGAEVLRADILPALRFDDMTLPTRDRYRQHYRAFVMWRRAKALGKTVEQLQPWVDYDAVLVDDNVSRWVHRGVTYAG